MTTDTTTSTFLGDNHASVSTTLVSRSETDLQILAAFKYLEVGKSIKIVDVSAEVGTRNTVCQTRGDIQRTLDAIAQGKASLIALHVVSRSIHDVDALASLRDFVTRAGGKRTRGGNRRKHAGQ